MFPTAFALSRPLLRNHLGRKLPASSTKLSKRRMISSQKPSPRTSPPSPPSPTIPGTPCFTPNILATPMPSRHRDVYLSAISAALRAYLTNLQSQPYPQRAQLTLLPPQLNPALDVYDRRFLLQFVWAAVSVTASLNLRTRVLIQGPRNFGAVPLSIAGLRRTFDADLALSIEDWPVQLRSGELENPSDVDEDDDIIFVVSPTNAVSIPVVTSVEQLIERIGTKPVILLNPRLDDIPSHSGVMQVSGRAERINFLETFQNIFYMRLLFKAGSSYPLYGIIYHAYPSPWQVWRSLDNTAHYALILSADSSPMSEDINNAFARDTYQRQKERLSQAQDEGATPALDTMLASPQVLVFLFVVGALAVSLVVDVDQLQHFLHSFSSVAPH